MPWHQPPFINFVTLNHSHVEFYVMVCTSVHCGIFYTSLRSFAFLLEAEIIVLWYYILMCYQENTGLRALSYKVFLLHFIF